MASLLFVFFLLLIYYLIFRNNVINLFIFPYPFNLDNSSIESLIGSLLSILFIFSAKFVKFISGLIRILINIKAKLKKNMITQTITIIVIYYSESNFNTIIYCKL